MTESVIKHFSFGRLVSLIVLLVGVYIGLRSFGAAIGNVYRFKCLYLLVVEVMYVVLWIKTTHRFNSLFFFFLLYFMVTNGGTLILNGIDWSTEIGTFAIYSYSMDLMNKALDYQLICTAVFVTAGILFTTPKVVHQEESKPFKLISNGNFRRLKTADWVFLVISVVYISICMQGVEMRSSMGYGDYYYSDNKVSVSLMVKYSFYVTMFYSLYNHISNRDVFRNIILLIDVILTVLLLILGSRNEIIPMAFGIVYIFGRAGYRLSKKQSVLSIVYAFLFLFLLGLVPMLRGFSVSSINSSVVSGVFSDYGGILSFLMEMGGSLRTTTETIAIAGGNGFKTEPTIIYTLLFGFVPTQRILDLFGFHQPQYWSLATWVTDLNGGGSGWGYSMLAESYYNFKEFGVLWFIVWAFLYTRLESYLEKAFNRGSLVTAAAWLYVGSYAIFLARADTCLIAISLRYTVYLTFIFLFLGNHRLIRRTKLA